MPDLFAYTDGACSGNPGPGGWGVLMIARDGAQVVKERTLQGGEAMTTNNRMELLAAISALEALAKPVAITIITDSAYVKNVTYTPKSDPFPGNYLTTICNAIWLPVH